MSASALHRQLGHNDIKERPDATIKVAARNSSTSIPAKLETRPPPLLPARKDHLQFYGFHINEDRVMKYASSRLTGPLTVWPTMFWFLCHVRSHAQYGNIDFQVAFGDEDPPSDAKVYESNEGTPYIVIFSLCTWEGRSWKSRPTLEEIKRISEIIGSEPRWFTDVKCPEDYENEN